LAAFAAAAPPRAARVALAGLALRLGLRAAVAADAERLVRVLFAGDDTAAAGALLPPPPLRRLDMAEGLAALLLDWLAARFKRRTRRSAGVSAQR